MLNKLYNIEKYLTLDLLNIHIRSEEYEYLNKEILDKLIELDKIFSIETIIPFFKMKNNDSKKITSFKYKDKCICGIIFDKKIFKTDLCNIVNGKFDFSHIKCKDCSKIERDNQYNLQRDKYNESQRLSKEEMKNDTIEYINNFLSPNKIFNEKLSIYEKFNAINQGNYKIDYDKVKNHIQQMNYKDFLGTPYWKAISLEKKRKANFKCQLCNSTGNLHTHHSTYEIRGMELQHMNKLTVLCENCHNNFHK